MVEVESRRCTLVTGPASSGKSLFAEQLAMAAGRPVTYLATGPQRPDDRDWQERLRRHRQRRPETWSCIEVEQELAAALRNCSADQLALVDSLGTWVAAALELDAGSWNRRCLELLESIDRTEACLILVAEEAAWGVVPATAIGGLFRQRLGQLLQDLMPSCDAAWLVMHGRAIDLLAISQPVTPQQAP
jgi:adenosylcobinamide kinase / adenosylcobinamide-phosphate guanylyltransferase